MRPEELGKRFIQINRSLTWAESPAEWDPAKKEMEIFINEIEDLLVTQNIDSEWSNKDFARVLAILLTILSEAGQYRFEAFVPNPEKENDIAKRKMIDEDMIPTMSSLRRRASEVTKSYFNRPVFSPIKKFIEDEIFPIVEGLDDSAPARYMPFRVIQAGNIVERLYRFKVRTQDKRLIGDQEHEGLLQSIYAFKYLRFGTSGVRGLWQQDFTETRAKQVVQAICEYLKNKDLPNFLKGEDLTGRTIIIGYDSRLNANKVAEWAAQTCLNNGFRVEFANRDTPTPALVYWLTDYHSEEQVAGLINITASHNPPEWQGIKFNPRQGWPAPTNVTDFIASRINEINILDRTIAGSNLKDAIDNGHMIGFDPIEHYTKWVLNSGEKDNRISIDAERIRKFFYGKRIIIDEMHGASRGYLSKILGEIGVQHTVIHAERNPLIPGLAYANPEEPFINDLKEKVKKTGAYLGLGMDTDADRFGIVDQGGIYFRPNQILPILVRYLGVDRGYKGRVIATQTGSPLLEILAGMIKDNDSFKPEANVIPAYIDHSFYHRCLGNREDQVYKNTFMVPVGIKYIEEQRRTDRRYRGLSKLPDDWRDTILIGGEESSGLTTKGHVTDKDGVWANLLVMDMLAYYGSRTEKPLASIAEIWKDTVSLEGLWESFGGKENYASPEKHSNAGRTDIDAILEVKEELINYYLNAYGPGKDNNLGGLDVIFAGGVLYDLAEIRLRDKKGDDRHFLRIRASGTEPINRVYIESSDPQIAKALTQTVLDKLQSITIKHLGNAPSDWVIAETLAYFDVSDPLLKAVKKWIAEHGSGSKDNIKTNLQTLASGHVLEKRNAQRANEWVAVLNN
jgi:phosphoglucomutase